MTTSYAFARRPAWVLGHVLVIIAVFVMINLGLWQLRRLDERRDINARVEQRSTTAPAPVEEVVTDDGDADALEFRRVEATGRFDPTHEVLVGYRTSNGAPGYHVVTPLELDDGSHVLVNRGWVPLGVADTWPDEDAAPPSGEVEVVGLLRPSVDAKSSRVDASADAPKLNNVDVPVIASYVGGEVLPMYIELQEPRTDRLPAPLPALDLGNGPHLSYAGQWFSFAAIAAIGWVVVLRRRARTVNAR